MRVDTAPANTLATFVTAPGTGQPRKPSQSAAHAPCPQTCATARYPRLGFAERSLFAQRDWRPRPVSTPHWSLVCGVCVPRRPNDCTYLPGERQHSPPPTQCLPPGETAPGQQKLPVCAFP